LATVFLTFPNNSVRARHELKIVKDLQQLLRQRPDIIVCRVDKSPGFYIGKSATIASKVQEYMTATEAYEKITTGHCPLADNFNAVMKLLNHLLKEGAITQKQYEKLSPKMTNLELAHFHCLPKVHKVGCVLLLCIYSSLFFLLFLKIGWNTNSTYYCWNSCTSNIITKIFKSSSNTNLFTSSQTHNIY